MKQHQALIQWIDPILKGRKNMPARLYCAPSKFQGWGNEAWSLYVEQISGFHDHPSVYRVMVWFLADNAPVEVLKPGMQFALYEGTKIVAVGKCI